MLENLIINSPVLPVLKCGLPFFAFRINIAQKGRLITDLVGKIDFLVIDYFVYSLFIV